MKSLLAKLNVETVILDLAEDVDLLPDLGGLVGRLTDGHTLEVDVPKESGLNCLFGKLTEQGINVLSMRNKANRLEELFVSLVEHKKESK